MDSEDRETRIRRLFHDAERDLLAYALRRVSRPEDAADIVGETFLVAWRRIDEIPGGDEARPWLFGVARHQLANQRRGELRQVRLSDRLRAELPAIVAANHTPPDDRSAALHSALGRLGEQDRELLMLNSWEGLRPSEIATVMELRDNTVRSRLHRARRRLRIELAREETNPTFTPATSSPLSKETR